MKTNVGIEGIAKNCSYTNPVGGVGLRLGLLLRIGMGDLDLERDEDLDLKVSNKYDILELPRIAESYFQHTEMLSMLKI